jgi:hypothetical protein
LSDSTHSTAFPVPQSSTNPSTAQVLTIRHALANITPASCLEVLRDHATNVQASTQEVYNLAALQRPTIAATTRAR